jgi:uncharacterized protein YjbI with pentapeptide repeats
VLIIYFVTLHQLYGDRDRTNTPYGCIITATRTLFIAKASKIMSYQNQIFKVITSYKLFVVIGVFICQLLFQPSILASISNDVEQLITTNNCSNCELSEVDLTSAKLQSADLTFANLNNSSLSKANLKSANLSHVKLQNSQLYGTDLSSANLEGADLKGAVLIDAILSNANLTNANLENCNLQSTRFIGFFGKVNLNSANLKNANLKGTRLDDVTLESADLSNANISKSSLKNANLKNANLQGANLEKTDFRGADLTEANLSGANLEGINLDNAILVNTAGLDPYGENLLEKANLIAKNNEFLVAIAYLKMIPFQTKVYPVATDKIAEYESKQKIKEQEEIDLKASEQLTLAISAADHEDYSKAIRALKRIPINSKFYSEAQPKIALYESKYEAQENARKTMKNAINILKPNDFHQYAYVDYESALNILSDRCSSDPSHIANMVNFSTSLLYKERIKFENMAFLKQALDATESGTFGNSCEEIFAILELAISNGI